MLKKINEKNKKNDIKVNRKLTKRTIRIEIKYLYKKFRTILIFKIIFP